MDELREDFEENVKQINVLTAQHEKLVMQLEELWREIANITATIDNICTSKRRIAPTEYRKEDQRPGSSLQSNNSQQFPALPIKRNCVGRLNQVIT